MIKRPANDKIAAHFFSKEGATHVPDDKRYLLSSKGQDAERLPLARSAAKLNGTDNFIDIVDTGSLSFGDGAGNDDPLTITGYCKLSTFLNQGLIFKGSATVGDMEYALFFTNTNKLTFFFRNSGGDFQLQSLAPDVEYQDQWIYIAVTYTGDFSGNVTDSMDIFAYTLDGTRFLFGDGGQGDTGYSGMDGDNAVNVTIGNAPAWTLWNSGYMYDWRIHTGVLTADQIEDVRNFKRSGQEVGHWAFEEKAGNATYDSKPLLLTTYASDFTADADGWTPSVTVLVANQDNIDGEDDCLKIYGTAGTGNHLSPKDFGGITTGDVMNLSMDVYVPSGQTAIDGFGLTWQTAGSGWGGDLGAWGGSGSGVSQNGYWVEVRIENLDVLHPAMRIYLQDGTASSTTTVGDPDDDRLYIKNVKFEKVTEANHGTVEGTLTSFWYEGADVPHNFSNANGYGKPTTYESDFSSGIDGWTETRMVMVAAANIGGSPINALSGRAEAVLNTHNISKTSILAGKNQILEFDIFMPSGQTNVNSYRARISSGGTLFPITYPVLDTWVPTSIFISAADATNTKFSIQPAVSGNTSFTGSGIADDDIIYVRNVVITETSVKPAINLTTDALDNALTYPGAVRHRAKVKDVNVGVFDAATNVSIPHSSILTFGDGTTDSPFSITAFGKMTSSTNFKIFTKSSATNSEYVFGTNFFSEGGQLGFTLYDSVLGQQIFAYINTLSSYVGQPLLFACSYDGSGSETGLNIYAYDINGVSLKTTITRGTGGTYVAMEGAALSQNIGFFEDNAQYANGDLWDIKVHNVELAEAQILEAFTGQLLGTEVAHWPFNEGQGDTVRDIANKTLTTYESNFSEGVDGWTSASAPVSAPFSIGGRSHAIKATTAFTAVNHYIAITTKDFIVGDTYKLSFWVYTPSSAPNITRTRVYVIPWLYAPIAPTDQWNYVEFEWTSVSLNLLRIYSADDNWDVDYLGVEGDVQYYHDILVEHLIGDPADGIWENHTDPNQWGKSDDAIDYNLLNNKLRGAASSKIDFNPYLALGEAVPTDYEAEGLVPADAYMYMNQTFIPSPTFGTEADDAITNMEIKTPYERQFVAEFVEELRAQSNYLLIDELMLLGLRHDAGLKMMKGSASPVNNGAVYLEGKGFDFSGTVHIDTLYNPATAGGVYSLDDAMMGAFSYLHTASDNNNLSYIFGALDNTIAQYDIGIKQGSVGNGIVPTLNGAALNGAIATLFLDNESYVAIRESSSVIKQYINGIERSNVAGVSEVIPSLNIHIGGRNLNGTVQANRYFTGVISSFVLGAGVGFDQLAYYNSLTKVQTKIELGNRIKDILIYNDQLKTANDVRRLYAFINEPVGAMHLQDYEAIALDNLIRNERSV